MDQSKLRPPVGAKHKRKRVGCGNGSGHGSYSGRGCKGQKSRSGPNVRVGFEGGQLPLIKRLPAQRGFTNRYKTIYSTVNVGKLNDFAADTEVTAAELHKAGMIQTLQYPIKILGGGDIDRVLTVKAQKFSASAKEKIVAAGGKAEEV
ncbi:MAG TPA: 50S ribosomal protein L15 [Dehalococcoidia bacterium]|nr:50S ribosomal protein L15 [Dehalococcoidia bacterium]